MCQQKLGLVTCVIFIAFVSFTLECRANRYRFYVVTPLKFYRSSQMPPENLKKYIQHYGIKTIINLRGQQEHAPWWVQEKKVADECGVEYYNIAMNSHTLPSKENLNKLLDIYVSAPLPILAHCKGGSERAGEAAALWLLVHENESKKKALKQLSFKYGYVRMSKPAKAFLIKIWQGIGWARNVYNPNDYPRYREVSR